ncbi:Arm DNA-binding domain-containing protein [Burkholderia diffusa]|uniref:Arm DNA-binding domain-containing protein n=1 Tax=Burkholderia diffusa TaxID=488732 RepID=UPI0008417C6B|nr:Arm DNA-binding domain-containing protein [Burkholderia diffusa]AOI57737.1 hypothetical protein WI26_09020 [Burkholderia diffusa]
MSSREKKGWKRGYSFRQSKDDTPFFTAPLTDIKIRQAQAGNKPTKLTDGNGLYLLAKPSGSKFRHYKYRIAGKENLCAIGEYPKISLQAARAARDDARELEGGIAESKSTKHQAGIDTPKPKPFEIAYSVDILRGDPPTMSMPSAAESGCAKLSVGGAS